MNNIITVIIKSRLILQLCELLLQPSLSLQTLIQPRNILNSDISRQLCHTSPWLYLLSKINLPHMFCLMISVWDVGEPLSSPQLLSGENTLLPCLGGNISIKYQKEDEQGRGGLMTQVPDGQTGTLVVHCRTGWGQVRSGQSHSPSWPDILMQAEAGNRLCFHWNPWELKQGESGPDRLTVSLTSPASPSSRPSRAAGRTRCSSPCCSGCRTSTLHHQTFQTELRGFTLHLFQPY